MSRYIVTGSTGFIGRNLVERLDEEMETVLPYGRANYPEEIIAANPDYIIHCAGETEDEKWMVDTNIVLTEQLLNAARKCNNLKAFVTIGSSTEQGKRSDEPTTYFDPTDIYGATKGAATLISMAYAREYGVPACVVRPMSLYGKYDRERRLIPSLYNAQFAPPYSMTIHRGTHDWMDVKDFVGGVLAVARSGKCKGDIVNLGTGIEASNEYIVVAMKEYLGVRLFVQHQDDVMKSYDKDHWSCNTEYALDKYGWEASISLGRGLQDYIAWRRSQPLPPF